MTLDSDVLDDLERDDDTTPLPTAPRDGVTRSVTFRADPSSDGLNLDGIAAVFNEWTTIDSWEGLFKERIAPGAFKKTLRERSPVLQFDHGQHPMIGSIPIGTISSLKETADGLRVKARMSDNWLVSPVRDAIASGAITGMSIRFRVVADAWVKPKDGKMPERTITEISLAELGPVVFPAYPTTSVGVRSSAAHLTAEQRAALALMLDTTTDTVAGEDDTPDEVHVATRTQTQRRALVRLRTS